MFCPKCGTENPDGANFCRSCGSTITTVGTTTLTPAAKTSGLAIASFVLGILSIFSCLLTAPIALILGIIALVSINKSNGQLRGTGFAIAGIVAPVVALPFIALMMGILMPALAKSRMIAYRMVCGTNMSGLSKAMMLYAGDYRDQYPTSSEWCDLLIKYEDCDPNQFRCKGDPEGPSSYAMNKNVVKLGVETPADMVLLFESKPGWNQSGGPELLTTQYHQDEGCNIAFCDGSVVLIKKDDIGKLRWTAGP